MSILKKYKTLIICFSIAFFMILPTISIAKKAAEIYNVNNVRTAPHVGKTVKTDLTDLENTNYMYCLQNHAMLNYDEKIEFKVEEYVKIEGNKATNSKGKTTNNIQNGAMAYIIAKGEGYGTVGAETKAQHAIWYYKKNWCQANSKLGNFGTFNTRDESTKNSLVTKAEDYANEVKNIANQELTDKTDKTNLKKSMYKKDNDYYVEVGPFKYEFPGKISSMQIVGDNNQNINASNLEIITKEQKDGKIIRKTIEPKEIKSGKNFYISVKVSAGVKGIVKITGEIKQEKVYTAEMWFLSSAERQNLLVTKHGEKTPDPLNIDFTYEINFTGPIEIEKVNKKYETVKLGNVGFIAYNNEIQQYVHEENGVISYRESKDEATIFYTKTEGEEKGKLKINNLLIGTYNLYEVVNNNPGYAPEPDKAILATVNGTPANYMKIQNEPVRGHIEIEKEDRDVPEYKLPNVGFIVEQVGGKGYVTSGGEKENDIPSYGERKNAKVFYTSAEEAKKGKFTVYELDIGYTYNFYEVENPNEGYVANPNIAWSFILDKEKIDENRTQYEKIQNRKEFVKLSGFVWEDKYSEKLSMTNSIYQSSPLGDSQDSKENIKDGSVIVRLMEKTEDNQGREVMRTTTTKGDYKFENVLIDNLPNYYIEFEYDGLVYENVTAYNNIPQEVKNRIINTALEENVIKPSDSTKGITDEDKENWYNVTINTKGSKATETPSTRDEFNNNFARVEGYDSDTVSVKNKEGQEVAKVDYNLSDYQAEIKGMSQSTIPGMTANTLNTGLKIEYDRKSLIKEITGLNLGLVKRVQADIALTQDLQEVKVSIKGKTQAYKKGRKNNDSGEIKDQYWNNVGTTRIDNTVYKQPVYRADYMFETDNDGDKLQMYFEYKIALRNQTNLTTVIHNITEYCDARFITDNLQITADEGTPSVVKIENVGARNKINIQCELELEANETKNIYITFPLNREKIAAVFNEHQNERFSSIAEISSYTSYKDGKLYATVDEDAVADNVVLDNEKRFEDDTDNSGDVQLYIAEARKIEGFAFEDKEIDLLLKNQQIREGNGKYDNGETKIPNIQVQLLEMINGREEPAKNEENQNFAITSTDNEGKYSFSGFTPGTYKVRFIWGEEQGGYKVTEYKATIVDEDEYNNPDKYFYRNLSDEDKLKSRATDNESYRAEIDKQLNSHDNEENNGNNWATKVTRTLMDSDTKEMTFDIEYEGADIALAKLENDGKLQFVVEGMNLGIIRRPVQSIKVDKRVSNVTVKYSSGEAIINADVDKDGNLSGQKDYISYIGNSRDRRNAMIRVELDEEVLQNSGIEVTYDFTITNTSEKDYNSIEFQKFGRGKDDKYKDESKIVTLTPTKIIDYLGEESAYKICDDNEHYGWELVTLDNVGNLVSDDVKTSNEIKTTKIYKTEKLNTTIMKPSDSQELKMVIEKRLSTSSETDKNSNLINQVEIVEVNKPHGSPIISTDDMKSVTLGNYVPAGATAASEIDDSMAETVLIIPSMGADRNYIPEIAIGLTALIALAGGTYIIKKIVTK